MRFMLMVRATGYSEAGMNTGKEYENAMIAYNESLAKAGVLLAAEELQPSARGFRIRYRLQGGEPEINAGPFPVDEDLMAGFTLIDVNSEEEAADWALQMPVPHHHGFFEIEVRKLVEEQGSIRNPRTLALEADLQEQLNMFKKNK